jgi:hypothetical protein
MMFATQSSAIECGECIKIDDLYSAVIRLTSVVVRVQRESAGNGARRFGTAYGQEC